MLPQRDAKHITEKMAKPYVQKIGPDTKLWLD